MLDKYLEKLRKTHSEGFRCRYCQSSLMRNWAHSNHENYSFIENLRCGSLYCCVYCNEPYYLTNESFDFLSRISGTYFLHHVPFSQIDELLEWNKGRVVLSINVPEGLYSYQKSYPCEVVMNDGEQIDFSIITISQLPPIEEDTLSASRISTIRKSRFALPQNIDLACFRAEEVHNGFFPTVAITPAREYIVFNGPERFYDGGLCEANQLRLSEDSYLSLKEKGADMIYNAPKFKITHFIADDISFSES